MQAAEQPAPVAPVEGLAGIAVHYQHAPGRAGCGLTPTQPVAVAVLPGIAAQALHVGLCGLEALRLRIINE